jgi:hypothetical protein
VVVRADQARHDHAAARVDRLVGLALDVGRGSDFDDGVVLVEDRAVLDDGARLTESEDGPVDDSSANSRPLAPEGIQIL